MIGGAPDAVQVLVSRRIPIQQLLVAEAREGPADEHERVERIEAEWVERRVTTERRTGNASVDGGLDVRQSDAACEMAVAIRHRQWRSRAPRVRMCRMRLVQVAQHADDLERAADFYTVLLESGPTATFDPPGLVFFDLDGVRLLLDRNAPSSVIYLHVDNVHEALERMDGLADVVSHPHVIFTHEDDALGPEGHQEWQAFIRDSEGNTVGLISFQRP